MSSDERVFFQAPWLSLYFLPLIWLSFWSISLSVLLTSDATWCIEKAMRDYFYDAMNKIFDLYLNKYMYFCSIRQQVSGMYYFVF